MRPSDRSMRSFGRSIPSIGRSKAWNFLPKACFRCEKALIFATFCGKNRLLWHLLKRVTYVCGSISIYSDFRLYASDRMGALKNRNLRVKKIAYRRLRRGVGFTVPRYSLSCDRLSCGWRMPRGSSTPLRPDVEMLGCCPRVSMANPRKSDLISIFGPRGVERT